MRRRGFSLIELLIVVAIMVTLMMVAIPNLIRARQSAAVTSAISSIRTLQTAEQQYLADHGRYVATLTELAGYIGPDLAGGEKDGYRFSISSENGGYAISAVPISPAITGTRSFYSDQTMVIRENQGPGQAGADSPLFKR
jgi:type IV pilus assembly protein PilA